MVLFSPDFKYKADRGSVFLLKVMHYSKKVFILQVKMADKGAALNLARKKKQEKKRKQGEARVTNLAKKQKIEEQKTR